MKHLTKCCQCLQVLSKNITARQLPQCEHRICQKCLTEIIQNNTEMIQCCFCSSMVEKPKIEMFTIISLTNDETYEKTLVNNTNNNNFESESQDNQLLKQEVAEIKYPQICQQHRIALDILCITDRKRICPHCALFGNHRNHRFKRVEDFEKEIQEKRLIYEKIKQEKQDPLSNMVMIALKNSIRQSLSNKKDEISHQISNHYNQLYTTLKEGQARAKEQAQILFLKMQQQFEQSIIEFKNEKGWEKLRKWEFQCSNILNRLKDNTRLEEKLCIFYDGPLELVSEGYLHLEELTKNFQQTMNILKNKILNVKISVDQAALKRIPSVIKLVYGSKDKNEQINPFLEYDNLGNQSAIFNISCIELNDPPGLLSNKSTKQLFKTAKKIHIPEDIKSIKSIDKGKIKSPMRKTPALSPRVYNAKPKIGDDKQISRVIFKSPSTKTIIQHPKPFEAKSAQKIFLNFSKNKLVDVFDISECYLPNEQVIEYVKKARKIHKTKGLRLLKNELTSEGFEALLDSFVGVSNINVSNNRISEHVLDLMLKNRQKLQSLKVIHLSDNMITGDRKNLSKIQQLKKIGIHVIL